ncbi:MAG: polysaccharide deacetylase family protein [Chlorobi bacterium]|nr:polysaccharide deacetylase family protein [Chlorobiota bacterium]
MSKYQISNIGFVLSLAIIIVLDYFFGHWMLLLLAPLITFYLSLIVMGSASIRFNFYLKSLKRGSASPKAVALTFDDGPDKVITPEILEILNNYNLQAAFFCVGSKIEEYPGLLKTVYNAGHIVGNHSYSHSKIFDLRSTANMVIEIKKTNKLINECIGVKPVLFRPPFGVTNPLLAKAIKITNVVSMGWSLRSWDTNGKITKVVNRLKRKVHSGDIILFHDNRPNTPEILARFIPYLIDNGYQIVPLDKFLKINPYESN